MIYFLQNYLTSFVLGNFLLVGGSIVSIFLSHLIVEICVLITLFCTQTMYSIWCRWSDNLIHKSPLRNHILWRHNRRPIRIKVRAGTLGLHHVCQSKRPLIIGRRHLGQAVCVWVNLTDFGEIVALCVIRWTVVTLVHRLVTVLLAGFHDLSFHDVGSYVASVSLSWPFGMLWVVDELLSIVLEVAYAVIVAVPVGLHWLHHLPALLLLSGHFHSEVHE